MKKLISAMLAAAMLTGLAGCSSGKEAISEMPSAAEVSSSEAPQPKENKDCQSVLDRAAEEFGFEGVVYVSQNGEMLCSFAAGKMNAETDKEISVDSQFCIASLSKQFTACAIMLLKEQGKLGVEDTLDVYFPEYAIGRDITVKDLLTMRSGIPDYYSLESNTTPEYGEEPEPLPFEVYAAADDYNNQKALTEWLFNQPLDFEPNTDFEYSNSNYLLLALIVEQVTGGDYRDFVRENIFEPLSMNDSGFIDDVPDTSRLAESVTQLGLAGCPGVMEGAGDIVSTAGDMDLWLSALRENRLISADSYSEMIVNYSADNSMNYGYGLMPVDDGGIQHTGSIASYRSFDYANPKTGYNYFAVTNNADALTDDISSFSQRIINRTMSE